MIRIPALLLALLLPATAPAAIDPDELLPVEQAFALEARAVERGRIELAFDIADGYYLYRHRMSARVLEGGFKANPLELPPGERKVDEFFGETETYRDAVVATLSGAAADDAVELLIEVGYQGCADIGICYPPHRQQVRVTLPQAAAGTDSPLRIAPAQSPLLVGDKPAPLSGGPGPMVESLPLPEEEAFGFEAIATAPDELLLRFTPAPGYYLYRDRSSFRLVDAQGVQLLEPAWPEGTAHEDEHFGEVIVYFDQVEVPLRLSRATAPAQSLTLEATFQGCQDDGICYPPMTRRVAIELPEAPAEMLATTRPPAAAGAGGGTGLLLALGLALLGGLVLNLMPCVLPVLSLKAIGLAETAGHDHAGRRHALWYTAGVLASFATIGLLVLALRGAGGALGWGFQLQQPVVVAVLAYVMLAIGLSLSGLWQIGAGAAGLGQSLTERGGARGDFFTGVLAVVVASPCTAPFMGTALAFAFGAPALTALLVFLALGLGLALPFLLIGFVPALARLLPRPGAWMDTFKQFMAFPMYLTAVWLVWVLARQRGADAVALVLAGGTLLAMALWWRERSRGRGVGRAVVTAAMLALAIGPLWAIAGLEREAASATTSDDGRVAYSAERLAALRADGRAVFVNMTADWCITCKANERAVLGSDAFRELLATSGAVYMVGDWTDVDAEISTFLDSHGAVGVPFYVVYPGGGGEGRVLPTVLTMDVVREALADAAGS